jgi:hypothetical protein
MIGYNNGADGLNRGIHYSSEFAALLAKKERFKGSKTMTWMVIWRCQPEDNSRD